MRRKILRNIARRKMKEKGFTRINKKKAYKSGVSSPFAKYWREVLVV